MWRAAVPAGLHAPRADVTNPMHAPCSTSAATRPYAALCMPDGTRVVRCAHTGAQCMRLAMARRNGADACALTQHDVPSARTQGTRPWLHVASEHRGCMWVSSSGMCAPPQA